MPTTNTAQKMKFFIKDFYSKCDQNRSFLRIWSHLLKKSLMENFIFCAVKHIFINTKSHEYAKKSNFLLMPGHDRNSPNDGPKHCTKMKFSIKDFFISSALQILSNLLTKSLIENFIFCAVKVLELVS